MFFIILDYTDNTFFCTDYAEKVLENLNNPKKFVINQDKVEIICCVDKNSRMSTTKYVKKWPEPNDCFGYKIIEILILIM